MISAIQKRKLNDSNSGDLLKGDVLNSDHTQSDTSPGETSSSSRDSWDDNALVVEAEISTSIHTDNDNNDDRSGEKELESDLEEGSGLYGLPPGFQPWKDQGDLLSRESPCISIPCSDFYAAYLEEVTKMSEVSIENGSISRSFLSDAGTFDKDKEYQLERSPYGIDPEYTANTDKVSGNITADSKAVAKKAMPKDRKRIICCMLILGLLVVAIILIIVVVLLLKEKSTVPASVKEKDDDLTNIPFCVKNPKTLNGQIRLDFMGTTKPLTKTIADRLSIALEYSYNSAFGCNDNDSRRMFGCTLPARRNNSNEKNVISSDEQYCEIVNDSKFGQVLQCQFQCTIYCDGCLDNEPLFLEKSNQSISLDEPIPEMTSTCPSSCSVNNIFSQLEQQCSSKCFMLSSFDKIAHEAMGSLDYASPLSLVRAKTFDQFFTTNTVETIFINKE